MTRTRQGMRARPVTRVAAVLVALALDELLGEPPARVHPVVAMGGLLDGLAPLVPAAPPGPALVRGGLAWGAGALVSGAAGLGLDRVARRLPVPAAALLHGVALWPLLSGRMLRREVTAVEAALALSLPQGREQVARLVSRGTADLGEEHVRAAALSSLSENLCDSVVAPLLAHAVGGLGGAAAYRWTNTADAVWGYRSPRWEHAGRVAARADDVANLVPARLTALLLLAVARAVHLLPALAGQARRTPSPNGGWPMGAAALVLDVRLVKPGVYVLHPQGRPAVPADTARALRLAVLVTVAAVPVTAVVTALVTALVIALVPAVVSALVTVVVTVLRGARPGRPSGVLADRTTASCG